MSIASKTMAMKARVFNQIRTDIYQKHIEESFKTRFRNEKILTEKEKLELFDKWFKLAKEEDSELYFYKRKRRSKAKIYKERMERGYNFKKKVSKQEYQKQC